MNDEPVQEELRFIYRVMREAEGSLRSLHRVLLFFGAFAPLASGGSYLLIGLYPPLGTSSWYGFWLLYWLGPVGVFLAHELRRQRWDRPRAWGEKLLWLLWGSCLGGGVLLGSVLPYLAVVVRAGWGLPPEQWGLIGWDLFPRWAPIAVLLGVALLLTGSIYRVRGLAEAGFGCWLTALLLALVPPTWVNGVVGVGLGASFLYGGWRLKRHREEEAWTQLFERFREEIPSEAGD